MANQMKAIAIDGGHALIGNGLQLFREYNNGRCPVTHRFHLSGENLLRIYDSIEIDELRKLVKAENDLPF
jgi:hypothetical protein